MYQKLLQEKPKLNDNAPILVEMFAGGGGVAAGAVMAGVRPAFAVEYDPIHFKLSGRLADMHDRNFKEYGCKMIRRSVQDIARLEFPSFPRNPDFLHASPVCSSFSIFNCEGGETTIDLDMAHAISKGITILQPKIFTLEQVPAYKDSRSWEIIRSILDNQKYQVAIYIVNMADYGIAQKERVRMVVVGSKEKYFSLPATTERITWKDAIADLIPDLPDSNLTESQNTAIATFLKSNEPQPLLVQRTKQRGGCRVCSASEQAYTLTRNLFYDGKGGNRSQFLDIWLPGGITKSLTLKAAGRLQGFPDWYDFKKGIGAAIGYSVPPLFMAQMYLHLLGN